MTRAKVKDLDYFVEKAEARLLKKFPHLTFEAHKQSDHEVVLYYLPYKEEDSYPVVHCIAPVAADAIDEGIRLWLFPGPARHNVDPPDEP